MICANCGANNPEESAFCGGCGSRLVPASGPAGTSLPSNQDPAIASSAAIANGDDSPTLRSTPESAAGGVQPPEAGGVAQFGAPAPQMAGGSPPAQGWPSGAYPAQGPAPSAPGWSSGPTYPAPPAPGWSSGAYPPTVGTGTEFPAGVYPTPGAAFSSGAYPPVTPTPGMQASGMSYPGQQSLPGWPGYPGQVPPPTTQGPSGLIRPLPLWAFITS